MATCRSICLHVELHVDQHAALFWRVSPAIEKNVRRRFVVVVVDFY